MLKPEEMLELAEKATPLPWNREAIYSLLRYGRKCGGYWDECLEKEPETNKPDDEDTEFIIESREFVPYAAERLIGAENMLFKIQNHLKYLAVVLGMERCYLDKQQTLDFVDEIKRFLEASK